MIDGVNIAAGPKGSATRVFGLIGYPLSHSFSANYFADKFSKEGLKDCRYELFAIPNIDDLTAIIKTNPGLEGLNVTIPYKRAVIPYLTSTENLPDGLNACNCIRIKGDDRIGHNTDIFGFQSSLQPLLKEEHRNALVLGNGGATAAVTYVLKQLGIRFDIVSRNLHDNATMIYADLDQQIIADNLLIINTTPLGMYPRVDEYPDIPYEFITDRHLLYDLIYNPPESVFLKKGREKGAMVKNGEEMLVLQAEESWRIWTREQTIRHSS